MGIFKNWTRGNGAQYHETGSDAPESSWSSEYTGSEYAGSRAGNTNKLAVFLGYGVNPARNNGEDIEPIPITPVRYQNWPEMQIQLCNGWDKTNYGKKMSYDDYLRMLTASSEKSRNFLLPSSGVGHAANPGPAPSNVQSMIDTTSGNQPQSPGGPGFMAGHVDLGGRRYYG